MQHSSQRLQPAPAAATDRNSLLGATPRRWLLLVMLLGPNAVAGALGVPVMTIGVKR